YSWLIKMSSDFPANSYFNIFFTLTFFIIFTGVLLTTFIAPMNVWPGSILFPKYVEDCVLTCRITEIPINSLWGGLINGGVYGVLGAVGYLGVRSIWRKIKK
ncbi:MAG: hypothetical protein KAW66_09160, partial [Candidatus Lokiarchaeota archaeon]|nr:hypothetical protein [Candidatus Lokiarchaeota archaeon]